MLHISLVRAEAAQPGERASIHLTYPGHYSPVEAGQLGVVIGNLLFDNPGEQADRYGRRRGQRVSSITQ